MMYPERPGVTRYSIIITSLSIHLCILLCSSIGSSEPGRNYSRLLLIQESYQLLNSTIVIRKSNEFFYTVKRWTIQKYLGWRLPYQTRPGNRGYPPGANRYVVKPEFMN